MGKEGSLSANLSSSPGLLKNWNAVYCTVHPFSRYLRAPALPHRGPLQALGTMVKCDSLVPGVWCPLLPLLLTLSFLSLSFSLLVPFLSVFPLLFFSFSFSCFLGVLHSKLPGRESDSFAWSPSILEQLTGQNPHPRLPRSLGPPLV